jgi:hypothetical protein
MGDFEGDQFLSGPTDLILIPDSTSALASAATSPTAGT